MKIEEKDGKEVLVFEDGKDDDLRMAFDQIMSKELPITDELTVLADKIKAITRKMGILKAELDLLRIKGHEELWGPIDAAYELEFGTEAPNLSYNSVTGRITIMADRDGGISDLADKLSSMDGLIGVLARTTGCDCS